MAKDTTQPKSVWTEGDMKLFPMVVLAAKNLEVDTELLAILAGYATKASANTAWHKLRKKINNHKPQLPSENDEDATDEMTTSASASPTSIQKGSGKKVTTPDNDTIIVKNENNDAEAEDDTPAASPAPAVSASASKKRGRPAKKSAKVQTLDTAAATENSNDNAADHDHTHDAPEADDAPEPVPETPTPKKRGRPTKKMATSKKAFAPVNVADAPYVADSHDMDQGDDGDNGESAAKKVKSLAQDAAEMTGEHEVLRGLSAHAGNDDNSDVGMMG